MEWIHYYLITCWLIAFFGLYYENIRGWVKTIYFYVSGYLYDLKADLEGVKPVEELLDDKENLDKS